MDTLEVRFDLFQCGICVYFYVVSDLTILPFQIHFIYKCSYISIQTTLFDKKAFLQCIVHVTTCGNSKQN